MLQVRQHEGVARQREARDDDLREQPQGQRDGRHIIGWNEAIAEAMVSRRVVDRDVEAWNFRSSVSTATGTHPPGDCVDNAS